MITHKITHTYIYIRSSVEALAGALFVVYEPPSRDHHWDHTSEIGAMMSIESHMTTDAAYWLEQYVPVAMNECKKAVTMFDTVNIRVPSRWTQSYIQEIFRKPTYIPDAKGRQTTEEPYTRIKYRPLTDSLSVVH